MKDVLKFDKDTTRRLRKLGARFEEDVRWLESHYEEFRSKYPDEFVAVFEKQVVGHHSDGKMLRSLLERNFSEEDISFMAMKYISSQKVRLIV